MAGVRDHLHRVSPQAANAVLLRAGDVLSYLALVRRSGKTADALWISASVDPAFELAAAVEGYAREIHARRTALLDQLDMLALDVSQLVLDVESASRVEAADDAPRRPALRVESPPARGPVTSLISALQQLEGIDRWWRETSISALEQASVAALHLAGLLYEQRGSRNEELAWRLDRFAAWTFDVTV